MELPRFKAARRDAEALRPPPKSKRQPRKWKVLGSFGGRTYVAHESATREAAEAWVQKQARSYYVGRRNAPRAMHDAAAERAVARAKRYEIVGPKELTSSPPT